MDSLRNAILTDVSEWTNTTLTQVINGLRERGGDAESIEVKSAQGGLPNVAPTLAAFANMPGGGILILGLNDPGFVPTKLKKIAELEAQVASVARTALDPPVQCTFNTLQYAGSNILVCGINAVPLTERPVRTKGRAYLRQSDGDYPMSPGELAHIELLKAQAFSRVHHDKLVIPRTSQDDLDDDLLTAFLRTIRATSRRLSSADDETLLRFANVVDASGELTVAGCYALGQYPQQHLPTLKVTAAVNLPASEPGRTRDLAHFDGPLAEQLESSVDWVRRNTVSTLRYDERGHGYDSTEIPMNAVREIIANALVHRSLAPVTDNKSIEIRLSDGKLTITSPGGLQGVSVAQLGTPNGKSAVNSALYEICKNVRLPDGTRIIESEGGGVREAQQALGAAGLRQPHFVDAGVRFTAIMWAQSMISAADLNWLEELPQTDSLDSVHKAILVSLRDGSTYSNAEIRYIHGPLDSREVSRRMQQLIDAGLVVMTGERGRSRYCLVEEPTPVEQISALSNDDVSADVKRETVLNLLDEPCRIGELMQASGYSKAQVRRVLESLRAEGLVEIMGTSPRTSQYRKI